MNYKKTKLKNGLRVITIPMKGTETATVMIMAGTGSRHETEKEAGLSHFIEHMFFKGTKKRPSTLAISEELDSIGGEFNAFTGKDTTGYYAKVDSKHLKTALDVISDIYLNSKIAAEEIERERGTILQELNMSEDTPMRSVSDVFENLLYKKSPLGREIIGYKKTIKTFKRKDFINYMRQFYIANNTVVCIAGKFNEKKAISQIKKYFLKVKSNSLPALNKITEKQSKPQVKIKHKKTDQTHLILGVRAYDYNRKDRFALSVLAVILGGNMSSRLFTEVRERRGLAYFVKTGVEAYRDCGYLATQAGVEHKNLSQTVRIILKEYKKVTAKKVSGKELQKAKDYIKGKSVMNFESSDEVAMFFIDQEVKKKKIMSLKKLFKMIDKVTADDILRVSRDIFKLEKLNLAVIGPHRDGKKLEGLLKV